MSSIHSVELDWIVAFQGNGSLKAAMIWFSCLGYEALPYVPPFVYFVVSRRAGARLCVLLSVTDLWITTLKLAFHAPRPFQLDGRIRALCGWGGYGLPSGHVLAASVVWPSVARAFRHRWVGVGAVIAVLLVSISRVYLGVHFISDVVAAWGFGAVLLWWFGSLERNLSVVLRSLTTVRQIALSLSAVAAYLGLGIMAQSGMGDSSSSSPLSLEAGNLHWVFGSGGALFGAAFGIIMARRWANFDGFVVLWRRGAALGYALAGAWLLREVGKLIPTPHGQVLQLSHDFLQDAIGNWWILFLAPWILIKGGLLRAATQASSSCPSVAEPPT